MTGTISFVEKWSRSVRAGPNEIAVLTVPEFQVITAVHLLDGEGSVGAIARYLLPRLGKDAFGKTFIMLNWLEFRGLVTCYWSDPVECDKRVYDLTEEGCLALRRARAEGKRLVI